LNLTILYKDLLEKYKNFKYQKKAFTLLLDVDKRLKIYPQDHPTIVQYRQNYLLPFLDYFLLVESLKSESWPSLSSILDLQNIQQDGKPKQCLEHQNKIIFILDSLTQVYPNSSKLSIRLARAYNKSAHYYLLLGQPKKAQGEVEKGLMVYPDDPSIHICLVHCYLFQEKYRKAGLALKKIEDLALGKHKKLRLDIKSDLRLFEKFKITYPNLKKSKKILNTF